jgi:hypothetical protein
LQHDDTYTDTKSSRVADEPRSQSHQKSPNNAWLAVLPRSRFPLMAGQA